MQQREREREIERNITTAWYIKFVIYFHFSLVSTSYKGSFYILEPQVTVSLAIDTKIKLKENTHTYKEAILLVPIYG